MSGLPTGQSPELCPPDRRGTRDCLLAQLARRDQSAEHARCGRLPLGVPSPPALELHCGCRSRALARLEVRIVGVESGKIRPDAVRKLSNKRVVVAQLLVVPPPRHLDAVLCPLKLVL